MISNKFSEFEDFYGSGEVDVDTLPSTDAVVEESVVDELTKLEEEMTKVYSTEAITTCHRENSEKEFYTKSKKFIKKFVGSVNKYKPKYEKQYKVSDIDILNLKKNNFTLKSNKLNSNEFKSTSVSDTPDYLQVNRRLTAYNNVIDCLSNNYVEILHEPVTKDNGYGLLLEDIVSSLRLQGFDIQDKDKASVLLYNKIVDIRPAFKLSGTTSLESLSYSHNDVIGFSDRIVTTIGKLSRKESYFKRLVTNPGKNSNISPLFAEVFSACNNPKDRVSKTEAIMTRLKRLSLLVALNHSVCGYALQHDFGTISDLSNIAINTQN